VFILTALYVRVHLLIYKHAFSDEVWDRGPLVRSWYIAPFVSANIDFNNTFNSILVLFREQFRCCRYVWGNEGDYSCCSTYVWRIENCWVFTARWSPVRMVQEQSARGAHQYPVKWGETAICGVSSGPVILSAFICALHFSSGLELLNF